jgi:hypothetical protein
MGYQLYPRMRSEQTTIRANGRADSYIAVVSRVSGAVEARIRG